MHVLLSNHVSTSRVVPVIEAVLKLCGKTANRLPSTSTINNFNINKLILSQKQIAEDVAPKLNTTLETDETSKYGAKYGHMLWD